MRRNATRSVVFVAGLLLVGALAEDAALGGQSGRGNAAADMPTLPYKLVEWPTPPKSAAGVPGGWNFIQVASVEIGRAHV